MNIWRHYESVETIYSSYVDELLNRAVICVDKETLLNKPTDPSESPLIFKAGAFSFAL